MISLIEAIHLTNIQSIGNLTLPLGRITVFTGPTDSGKSAVIRGLLAFFTNKFKKSLLRKEDPTAKVGVVIEGVPIGFVKGSSMYYFIGSKKFSKVGKDIPKEIKDIIKMEKIVFDKDLSYFLNFQSQLQPQFLVNDYGGIASRVIGKLSNLGTVYIARRKATSEHRSAKQHLDLYVSELDQHNASHVRIKSTIKSEIFIDIQAKIDSLKDLENSLSSVDEGLKHLVQIYNYELFESGCDQLAVRIPKLETLQDNIQEINQSLVVVNIFSKDKAKFDAINASGIEIKTISLEVIKTKVEAIDSDVVIVCKAEKLKSDIESVNKRIETSTKELDILVEQLGVCPYCSQELSEKGKSFIAAHGNKVCNND